MTGHAPAYITSQFINNNNNNNIHLLPVSKLVNEQLGVAKS